MKLALILILSFSALTGPGSVRIQPEAPAPVRTIDTELPFARSLATPGTIDRISFSCPPLIESGILHYLDDDRNPGVAVNLRDAHGSNRFGRAPSSFDYRYLGMTDSGVQVLETSSSERPSGSGTRLLFLSLELAHGIGDDSDESVIRADREWIVLRRWGAIDLGDSPGREIRIRGNDLLIGRDRGSLSRSSSNRPDDLGPAERLLTVDLHPRAPLVFAADTERCAAR